MATTPSSSCVAREWTDFGKAVGRYDGEGAIATGGSQSSATAGRRGRVELPLDREHGRNELRPSRYADSSERSETVKAHPEKSCLTILLRSTPITFMPAAMPDLTPAVESSTTMQSDGATSSLFAASR